MRVANFIANKRRHGSKTVFIFKIDVPFLCSLEIILLVQLTQRVEKEYKFFKQT